MGADGGPPARDGPRNESDRWLSGQKQQTVNLPAHVAYGGSNPPLSTRKAVKSDPCKVAGAG